MVVYWSLLLFHYQQTLEAGGAECCGAPAPLKQLLGQLQGCLRGTEKLFSQSLTRMHDKG